MSDKTISQKLLIKPNTTVWFVNPPSGYLDHIGQLPEGVKTLDSKSIVKADFIQVFVGVRIELEAVLPMVKARMTPSGVVWITYHKGTSSIKTDINRDSIWKIAEPFGLKPFRQIAVDDNWSALGFKNSG
jgi:hypothetical protein